MRPAVLYCIEPGESSLLKQEMQMIGRRLHAASAVLAAALMASGCVSTGTYEKLEADKNQEISALQKQRGGVQEKVQGMKSQKATTDQDTGEQTQQSLVECT